MRTLACRAVWTALDARPGVVHLNVPPARPLVPPAELPEPDPPGRPDDRPVAARARAARGARRERPGPRRARARPPARRPSSSGRHELMTPVGAAAERFAQRIGWPVLADPLGRRALRRRGDRPTTT
jgi:2-succinyl-5-enolpyruvyl-6-hydroxy-3-cyclohexene-1-carboxylate synthase